MQIKLLYVPAIFMRLKTRSDAIKECADFYCQPVCQGVCLSVRSVYLFVCLVFNAIICLIGSIKLSCKLIKCSAAAANLRSKLNNHVDNYGSPAPV